MVSLSWVLERPAVPRLDALTAVCTLLLAALGLSLGYPVFLVLVQSFNVADPGAPQVWSLQGWQSALSEPTLRSSLVNTVVLAIVKQAITLPLAIAIAWLLSRTDIPARGWLEFGFWAAFFLPALTVAQSWILLADPHFGLLNQIIASITGNKQGPFNIYTFWGIVWVDVVTGALTIKVILLTPAFRYMNAAYEEASRIVGAGSLGTLLRITIPIMMPAILVIALLGFMASLQSFEIEQVLGAPIRFFVFSTMIYNLVESSHPNYAPATALAVFVLIAALPLVLLQHRLTRSRDYTTVTSQFRNQVALLGRWRWACFVAVAVVLLAVLGVPLVFTTLGTFMTLFGFFNIATPWTVNNWQTAFRDPLFLRSLANTLELAVGTVLVGLLLYSLVAYVVVRSRYRFRRALDFISWLPFTVPGLILSLAMLWLFLGVIAFRPLYGTIWVLILTGALTAMPLGVQIVKSSLLQLGVELEEASRLAGGSWLQTYREIVLRLLGPALLTVGLIVFVGASRNIGYVALLSTSANQPLAMLQLNYLAQGNTGVASVIAFIVMLASLGGALLARVAGFRGAAI
jgi:iron(III) transport system permease protein